MAPGQVDRPTSFMVPTRSKPAPRPPLRPQAVHGHRVMRAPKPRAARGWRRGDARAAFQCDATTLPFAERPGSTTPKVLSRSPSFLMGVGRITLPANYEPLDEPLDKSIHLSAVTQQKIMKLKDEDRHELSVKMDVGECWYMDWTRKLYESTNRYKCGLVFVESKTWLLRARFSQEKSAERLVEGIGWLRNFVRRATRNDRLEVHGDSETSWTKPGRGRDLNSAVDKAPDAVKGAIAHRIQAAELRQAPWGPNPVYLDARAVLHGAASEQVSQEMKYLPAKLAIVQEARAQGKAKAVKIDGSYHPPEIMTRSLQRKECVFKRGNLLDLKVTPPVKPGADGVPVAAVGKAEGKDAGPRRIASGPAPGTWGRALKGLPG